MSLDPGLDAGTREAVLALAAAASRADDATALSEDAVLRLAELDGPDVTHLLRRTGDVLTGYAQLVPAGDGLEGELLVHPGHRRRGTGTSLAAEVEALAGGRAVRLWSHGDTPGARALAARRGWARVRELLRLERPAAGLLDLEVPDLPAGLTVRPFEPGADDDAWVALNAAAFATHPEQGRWTVEDLRARFTEAWFDPSLLLLAQDADGLVASCWMKVEDGHGELYVLGVAPGRSGAGLGRALLVRGLRAVAAASAVDTVDLYVDGDNVPAVKLYARLGFERAAVDVQYARPAG
ncbi:mycothiol synthase [Kineococcus rhizosphaerae]|uniref:Mycothiol acetyltransferase n=1 Tax=Kineococcus rhizosphaerae TaxID=559628 RepID=A0A2T0QY54_9ACTN|nr:mycothiol synthase [Kineococcus rhizosphaerae]PRY11135.1 mycothiol synthase [Kineococcus rhizosphaerae]